MSRQFTLFVVEEVFNCALYLLYYIIDNRYKDGTSSINT